MVPASSATIVVARKYWSLQFFLSSVRLKDDEISYMMESRKKKRRNKRKDDEIPYLMRIEERRGDKRRRTMRLLT